MNIAIDISPLHSGHKIRGTGFYLTHLKDALLEYYPKNIYHFFSKTEKLPKHLDLIHYPYFEPFFLTLPLWKRYKTVVTVHDLTPLVFPNDFPAGKKGMLKWQIQKLNLKKVDAIITDSYSSKKDIEKICGISSEKISVVYLAAGEQFRKISSDKINEIKKKYALPESFLLYVGDATANKNLARLIEAATESKKYLVIVGKSIADDTFDKNNKWNKSLVTAKKLLVNNPYVTVVGFVPMDDLVAIYNAATAFIMPSLYEGFGLPILEAMACHCPVITTKEGSLAEVAGEGAFYVDPYNNVSIREGITTVMDDKSLQKKLVEKGLEQCKKFSWEKTAKETIKVYEEVFQK